MATNGCAQTLKELAISLTQTIRKKNEHIDAMRELLRQEENLIQQIGEITTQIEGLE